MSYLKSMAASFVYVAFFLAVITFAPGMPPFAEYSEYSVKPLSELVGVLAPNNKLNSPELLFKGDLKGPESFDTYNGELYTGLHSGHVVKIVGDQFVPIAKFGKECDGHWQEEICGRPLGLKFDKQGKLYVVDAYYGIFKVDVKTGKHKRLFDPSKPIEGKVPMFFNSVDVAENGDVYWTDSSTEFKLHDGAFVMLANPSGRLMRYNAARNRNEVLLNNLGLANGLKLSDDESYLLVIETMTSSIFKYHLKGPKANKREAFIESLPGSPDNIHSDFKGNYLVSLVATADPEHPQLTQTLAPHPYIRKMLSRLLALLELPFKLIDEVYSNDFAKKITHSLGHFEGTRFLFPEKVTVLRISPEGKIIEALHNDDEKIAGISSAFVHGDHLWLGSPFNEYLARVPLKQAFPNVDMSKKETKSQRIANEKVVKVEEAPKKVEQVKREIPVREVPVSVNQEEAKRMREAEERAKKVKEAEERAKKVREAEERAQKAKEAEEKAKRAKEAEERAQKAREAEEKAKKAREAEEKAKLVREAEEKARKLREAEEQARKAREAEEKAKKAREAEEKAKKAREAEEKAKKAREAEEKAKKAREAEEKAKKAKEAEEKAKKLKEAEERAQKAREAEKLANEAKAKSTKKEESKRTSNRISDEM